MNKQEHHQILSSELARRDAFWKAEMQKEIQKIKKEYEIKIDNINKKHENSFESQLGKLITNMVKQTVKEEVINHLKIDVDKKYDPYSNWDDHEHHVSIDWNK